MGTPAAPATTPSGQRSLFRRPSFWIIAGITWVLLIIVVAVAILATRPKIAPAALPADWHDVSAPQHGAFQQYAVSSRTSGTVVALIGTLAPGSTGYPPANGTLWRSQDGGEHWTKLTVPFAFTVYAQLGYVRGGGPLYLFDNSGSTAQLQASLDDGTSWREVRSADASNSKLTFQNVFESSYWRDGALYAQVFQVGMNQGPTSTFSVSHDLGAHWNAIEVDGNSAPPYTSMTGIAPDSLSPTAWFRFRIEQTTASIEHSDNNGNTWGSLTTISQGNAAVNTISGRSIVTDPAQPRTVCVVLRIVNTMIPNQNMQVVMLRSDDSGVNWIKTQIPTMGHNDRYAGPLLAPDGSCAVAVTGQTSSSPKAPQVNIWSLRAGSLRPVQLLTLPLRYPLEFELLNVAGAQRFALFSAPDGPTSPQCFICIPNVPNPNATDFRFAWHDLP